MHAFELVNGFARLACWPGGWIMMNQSIEWMEMTNQCVSMMNVLESSNGFN